VLPAWSLFAGNKETASKMANCHATQQRTERRLDDIGSKSRRDCCQCALSADTAKLPRNGELSRSTATFLDNTIENLTKSGPNRVETVVNVRSQQKQQNWLENGFELSRHTAAFLDNTIETRPNRGKTASKLLPVCESRSLSRSSRTSSKMAIENFTKSGPNRVETAVNVRIVRS